MSKKVAQVFRLTIVGRPIVSLNVLSPRRSLSMALQEGWEEAPIDIEM